MYLIRNLSTVEHWGHPLKLIGSYVAPTLHIGPDSISAVLTNHRLQSCSGGWTCSLQTELELCWGGFLTPQNNF